MEPVQEVTNLAKEKMTQAKKAISLGVILAVLEHIPMILHYLIPGIQKAIQLLQELIADINEHPDPSVGV